VKSKLTAVFLIIFASVFLTGQATAATGVNLNGPNWLGHLKLEKAKLKAIQKAFKKALDAPVDAEQQCGEARQDCSVRAAREWKVDGQKYREMVIYLHTIGHASRAVGQSNGKWPAIAAN